MPEKYYLTQKACMGILRRANERNKELPMQLQIALMMQAVMCYLPGYVAKRDNKLTVVYDIQHRSDVVRTYEGFVPALTARAGTGGNNVPIVLNDQGGSVMNVEKDKVGTLRAQTHGNNPIVFEPGVATRDGGHVYMDGKAPTLMANPGDNMPTIMSTTGGACMGNKQGEFYDKFQRGQGTNPCGDRLERRTCTCNGKQIVGSLCAHDGRGFNGQDVADDKLVLEIYETDSVN